jgi:hypothetical protein
MTLAKPLSCPKKAARGRPLRNRNELVQVIPLLGDKIEFGMTH